MKKYFIFTIGILFSLAWLTSCGDDGETSYVELSSFSVALDVSVTPNRAVVTFTPTQGVDGVKYALAGEADRDKFSNGTLEGIETREGDTTFAVEFLNLDPADNLTVFARAFDKDGNNFAVASHRIQLDQQQEDISLRLQYATQKTAGVKLELDRSVYYRVDYYFGTPADRDDFYAGNIEGITTLTEITGRTFNYFDLMPDTNYAFFCNVYDRTDALIDTREVTFRTNAEGAGPEVSVTSNIDVFRGDYTFTPNDHCGKVVAYVFPKGNLDASIAGYSHNIFDLMIALHNISYSGVVSATGEDLATTLYTMSLLADYEIEAYVVVYDNNLQPYGLYYYEFSTPAYDSSLGEASVSIEVSNITSVGATYTITANDDTLLFYYDTIEVDYYNTLDPETREADLLAHFMASYEPHHVPMAGKTLVFTATDAYPDTDFYAGVIALNANGIEGVGSLVLVPFTTLE